MKSQKLFTFRLLALALATAMALALLGPLAAQDPTATARPVSITLESAHFAAGGMHDGTVATAAGLTLQPGAPSGVFVALPIAAPLPFNVAVPRWQVTAADEHDVELEVRTRGADGAWSSWREVHANHDLTQPDDTDVTGAFVEVLAGGPTHTHLQYRVTLSREPGQAAPTLHDVAFTFIDSTAGPTAADLQPQLPDTPAPGYPKPAVVPRSQWCIYAECTYDQEELDDLEFVSVDHLVVHHTVTNGTDYLAVVRAIWQFHTFSRGWGDIGYNYLVDPNGVIYEGHFGGDDVVGTHAGNANYGTMGVALIGDFTSVTPSNAMLNSLANLLAWKAAQKGIDPFDASRLPPEPPNNLQGDNVSWGLPNLMGHRDVLGGTSTACPGELTHQLLPWLREEVANRMGYASPYIYVEEWLNGADTSIFTKSSANWYTAPGGCGRTRHAYYTYSTTDESQSANWGIYRPDIPIDGAYALYVYAPYCDTGRAETDGATYEVHHANGASQVTVSQNNNVGLWMNLGTFTFRGDDSGWIFLDDQVTTDNGLGVWFDAIRLKPQAPLAGNVAPEPNVWWTDRVVTFEWSLVNFPDATTINVQASPFANFSNLHLNATLSGGTTFAHRFSQDYGELYWRVRASNNTGTEIYSTATKFGLDSRYPQTAVQSVTQTGANTFLVTWGGADATSGISRYNIDYWAVGNATWTRWLSDQTATSATFTRPDGRVYWFRSQAIDNAGNIEFPHIVGDLATGVGPNFPVEKILLPLFYKQ